MLSSPPAAAWFVLGLLCALLAGGYLAGVRRRSAGVGPPSSPPGIGEVHAIVVTVACAVPGVVAVLTGAPWDSWLWWQVAGIAAAVVLVTHMATLRLLIRDRDELRQLPLEQRAATRVVVVMTFAGALAVPIALILILMWGIAELDVRTSVATGLAVDYALWLIAYAMVRRGATLTDAG